MNEDELNALTEKSLAVSFVRRSHYTMSFNICVYPCSSVANCQLLVRDLKPGGKSGREGNRPTAPAGSLFNLHADPGETRDVSADHPKIVADLRRRMNEAVRKLEANSRPIGRLQSLKN